MSTGTAVATKGRVSVDQFVAEVLPPAKRDEVFRGLPSHIKPAVYERNLINAMMINPGLMLHHPSLIFREVSKAAALGLLLDPALGEAYIIEGWNGKAKRTEPQLRIGYRGMLKLAKQTGNVEKVYCRAVSQNDEFIPEMGTDEKIVHRPVLFGDSGPIIGYYAVIKFKSGGFDFEPMSVEQIHRIRDRSDGWKAFLAKKIQTTPWATDEDEMAKKTTIRRLLKRQALSSEMAAAIEIEDGAEFPDFQRPSAIAGTSTARLAPPLPPDEPDEVRQIPSDDQSERGEAQKPETKSDGSSIEDGTDWDAFFDGYKVRLRAAMTFDALEEERDMFMATDQLPRAYSERGLDAYEAEVERLEKAAEKAIKKARAAKPDAKLAATGDAAQQQQADPPPPPADEPPEPPPPPEDDTIASEPATAGPTPAEMDEALALQRDPKAIVRQLARQKAKNGYRRFLLWWKSLSDGDKEVIQAMPDFDDLANVSRRVDAASDAQSEDQR